MQLKRPQLIESIMIENLVTHTDPQIVHSPGFEVAKPQIWKKLLSIDGKIHEKVVDPESNLDLITWSNQEDSILEMSLKKRHIQYHKLGNNLNPWNNMKKFDLVVNFAKGSKSEFIMGLDSVDVLFLGSPQECLKRFKTFECGLLFNGEKKFYPQWDSDYFRVTRNFQEGLSGKIFKHLNSGAWIGERKFVIHFFEYCSTLKLWGRLDLNKCPLLKNCDQSAVHGGFMKYHPSVKIDYECKVFQNLAHVTSEVCINFKTML